MAKELLPRAGVTRLDRFLKILWSDQMIAQVYGLELLLGARGILGSTRPAINKTLTPYFDLNKIDEKSRVLLYQLLRHELEEATVVCCAHS